MNHLFTLTDIVQKLEEEGYISTKSTLWDHHVQHGWGLKAAGRVRVKRGTGEQFFSTVPAVNHGSRRGLM